MVSVLCLRQITENLTMLALEQRYWNPYSTVDNS